MQPKVPPGTSGTEGSAVLSGMSKASGKAKILDPRAQAAISHMRANSRDYVGAILIRNLPAALPKRGERRSSQDMAALLVLMEIIGVHRVAPGKDPYWSGVLYQVNRSDLSFQFGCDPDDVSSALQWLKQVGLVEVVHHTRMDDCGKPCGTQVFAAPRMDRIKLMLDFYVQKQRPISQSELMPSSTAEGGSNSHTTQPEVSIKTGSPPVERSRNLNCAKPQRNLDAESGGEESTQQQAAVVPDDRRIRAADGGGAAASSTDAQVPEGLPAPALLWTPPPIPKHFQTDADTRQAWEKSARFCELWAEAVMREDLATVCRPSIADLKAATEFFRQCPQTGSFYAVAVGLNAWWASLKKPNARWDGQFLCRQSHEIRAFLRNFSTSKLEVEIRKLGWTVNAFTDLRRVFTASELTFYGWSKVPVIPINAEDLWENAAGAEAYYKRRKLVMPSEVGEAASVRKQEERRNKAEG